MGRGNGKFKSSDTFEWEDWDDPEILDMRFCDLGLHLKGSWLERPRDQLYEELERRNLRLKPHLWLSEEWACPDGIPGFSVPFYLAHPRLMRLERNQMLEVEGGNLPWAMKLMRHEAGHAFQNGFRIHRRKKFREIFGSSSKPYPHSYQPSPISKNYVLNLYSWYAQSHPAEDFAETFAVWLKPKTKWRRRYADWPALAKLEYVDELMESIEGESPPIRSRKQPERLSQIKRTIRDYYQERKEFYGTGYPDFYDKDLRRLFSDSPKYKAHERASAFLRRNRKVIRAQISRWTGEYAFTLDQVFTHMIGRCRELGLRVVGSEEQVKMDFVILLTMRTMQYLHTSRERIPL